MENYVLKRLPVRFLTFDNLRRTVRGLDLRAYKNKTLYQDQSNTVYIVLYDRNGVKVISMTVFMRILRTYIVCITIPRAALTNS